MTDTRPPLASSFSFAGLASENVIPRPLKRNLASVGDLDFFTDAATSFKPRPYTPSDTSDKGRGSQLLRHHRNYESHRNYDSLATPPAGMEPQAKDPNVVFIHPPFTTFPKSEDHPSGLTFHLLSLNPEWFLDANDFISLDSTNPNAIPYPPHLEPPRGWCPAKKKDLKDRGPDGWPEGEEPRLRCTFCRRTYAGVNAKSMWRRHVFEKHKIAMSNRRDTGGERPRGRGSMSQYTLFPFQCICSDLLLSFQRRIDSP